MYTSYNTCRTHAYAKSEVCTLDVIDGCAVRFPNDPKAMSACKEGARDSYLMSDIGRGKAIGNGKMDAYATGYYTTNALCGGMHTPFALWW